MVHEEAEGPTAAARAHEDQGESRGAEGERPDTATGEQANTTEPGPARTDGGTTP